MQHDLITINDACDAPYPFHPHRPSTPTVRYMAFDGDRHDRPHSHIGHFNVINGTVKKAIGQLLSREWMIEEGEEKVEAGRAEIDAANKEYEQRQRKYKQRRSMQSNRYSMPITDNAGRHLIETLDTGRRRYRFSPKSRTAPAELTTAEFLESYVR